MVQKVHVEGYHAYQNAVNNYQKPGVSLFSLFCGTKDKTTGSSWCPDCVAAEPVIENAAQTLGEKSVLILCEVGGRDYWKNKSNEFRTDNNLALTAVPTLINMATKQRLVEAQCQNPGLVSMLFEDE